MKLWSNRLYPKPSARKRVQDMAAVGGDTNLYYTLPVTQTQINPTDVRSNSANTVHNHSESTVRNTAQNVSRVKHENAQTYAPSNVTYQTTVQVEMVNHNQIHGEQDLNRLVQYLRDALEETLASSAEGVM